MKRIAGSMVFLAILTGFPVARDMVREVAGVEQARVSLSHVPNQFSKLK